MKEIYSVEVDRYNPMALAHCLELLNKSIPDFKYNWRISANGGGIDYGLYLNINIADMEIEICNEPEYGSDGDDDLYDVIKLFEEPDEDED